MEKKYLVILGNDKDAISSHLTEVEFESLLSIIDKLLSVGVKLSPIYNEINNEG